jgi:hypothetical protein
VELIAPSLASSGQRTLWIVCPVYYDVESFLRLQAAVQLALTVVDFPLPDRLRFVVIDDTAGQDPDLVRLEDCPDVTILQTPFNLGHQHALVFGLRSLAREIDERDWIATLDADGEDQPSDLGRLLKALSGTPGDAGLVLARRTKRREPLWFKILYCGFRVMFRALTGTVIQSGNYAAFHGELAKRLLFHPAFDLSYASAFLSLNRPVVFVPCDRGTRYAGQSKMGLARLITHGVGMLMPFVDRIAARALIGFAIVFITGVSAATVLAVVRWSSAIVIPGWMTPTLLLILMMSFSALTSFLILFTVFAQSGALSLRGLHDVAARRVQARIDEH